MTWTNALFMSLGFAVLNIVLFQVTFQRSPFAIFDFGYLFILVPGMPICASVILWYVDRQSQSPSWKPTLATILAFLLTGFLHFAIVAQISASV